MVLVVIVGGGARPSAVEQHPWPLPGARRSTLSLAVAIRTTASKSTTHLRNDVLLFTKISVPSHKDILSKGLFKIVLNVFQLSFYPPITF